MISGPIGVAGWGIRKGRKALKKASDRRLEESIQAQVEAARRIREEERREQENRD
jgi:hypothetical protein